MTERIRIGTRKSALALWQANHVASLLRAQEPGLEVVLVELTTQGDKILDRPLASVGGKGLFVKEIEDALLRRDVDLAVHSLKDLPAQVPPGLVIGAVPTREDPRDALCSPEFRTLDALPKGAKVGTSSLRRASQLRALRPDLQIHSIRGNVETRLKKIETEKLQAVVLAYAGLKRLGLEARATQVLSTDQLLPAVGQGALALEQRVGDVAVSRRLAPLEEAATRVCVEAERAFLARLQGGCQVPLAAHAQLEGELLTLRGLVATPDGTRVLRDAGTAPVPDAAALGRAVAESLLEQGAAEILGTTDPAEPMAP
ncbi:MAG: hydroxymethylbilane synthase [Deltaproteobacteria bacterium]|nr:hydroxymethylbilane synthase [Deltaproteobacteria bacterium]